MESGADEKQAQNGFSEDEAEDHANIYDPENRLFIETKKMLNVFPEEIWNMILDKIINPDDLENVMNASVFFRDLLFPKRAIFLFPKVWEVFEKKFTRECEEDHANRTELFWNYIKKHGVTCKSCQNLRYSRSFSEVLSLRLVCKTWNTVIDNFYQNRQQQKMIKDFSFEDEDDDWTKELFVRDGVENTDKFLLHFAESHGAEATDRSPFIGRAVGLEYVHYEDETEEPPEFPISSLLTKYGHHVWYCSISFEESDQLSASGYSIIREWLSLLPNLKVLNIRYSSDSYDEEVDFASEELETNVLSNSPPSLEHLQFLRTMNLPSAVFNGILRRNNYLSKLEVIRNASHTEYDLWSLRMPNLEQLSISMYTEDEYQRLENSQVNWPLSILELNFCNNVFIEWSRVFSLLENKWSNSLTNLAINLPKAIRTDNKKNILLQCCFLQLNLPFLKHLKLIIGNVSSLDYLLPISSTLETLNVCLEYEGEGVDESDFNSAVDSLKRKQIIQFLDYEKCLYDSNIWNIFPSLLSVKLSYSECINNDVIPYSALYSRIQWEKQEHSSQVCNANGVF